MLCLMVLIISAGWLWHEAAITRSEAAWYGSDVHGGLQMDQQPKSCGRCILALSVSSPSSASRD